MKHELKIVVNQLERMSGWQQLTPDQQKEVRREDDALINAAQKFGFLKIEIGRHFYNIASAMKSRGMFDQYIAYRGLDRRSVYRYKLSFGKLKEVMPPSMIQRAADMGINIYGFSSDAPLGEYGKAIKRLPPPQTEDPKKQEQYLLKLREEVRADRRQRVSGESIEKNYDELVKEMFRLCRPRLQRLEKKERPAALKELFGYLLASVGGKSAITVEPQTVPKGFIVPRGRPRKQVEHPSLAAA